MNNQEIDDLLARLHKEIEEIQSVDERGQELLRALSGDIQALLRRSGGGVSSVPILDRLEASIDHFEVTHPELTSALSNLLAILSNAGI